MVKKKSRKKAATKPALKKVRVAKKKRAPWGSKTRNGVKTAATAPPSESDVTFGAIGKGIRVLESIGKSLDSLLVVAKTYAQQSFANSEALPSGEAALYLNIDEERLAALTKSGAIPMIYEDTYSRDVLNHFIRSRTPYIPSDAPAADGVVDVEPEAPEPPAAILEPTAIPLARPVEVPF